jgi:SAM-dependent methyltransferase
MAEQPLTAQERTLPGHLGGHFGNVNKDWPTLRYLMQRYGCRTFLDVGCGPGGMLDEAQASGMEATGIDGDWHLARADGRIIAHDYTSGPLRLAPFDLVWCTEFVEHVDERFVDNFLTTFDSGRVLFLTAAPPGFPGHHHVNCQPESYWIDRLAQRGWAQDIEATQWVRANGGHVFTTRQGLVFVTSSSRP